MLRPEALIGRRSPVVHVVGALPVEHAEILRTRGAVLVEHPDRAGACTTCAGLADGWTPSTPDYVLT